MGVTTGVATDPLKSGEGFGGKRVPRGYVYNKNAIM